MSCMKYLRPDIGKLSNSRLSRNSESRRMQLSDVQNMALSIPMRSDCTSGTVDKHGLQRPYFDIDQGRGSRSIPKVGKGREDGALS